ncbi:MAG: PepSY domain-containing protein [Nitrosomonas sp.]|nr:PepSY domain-containing protein [Nitrosomonas sp.]MCW5608736.1 PepSY domain-containing protein [Nitrosomonas sp.]
MNIFKRPFWVCLHRWAGLTIAGFLIPAGLTGSVLVFYPELERQINPQFYTEQTNGHILDIATLAERARQQIPSARVDSVVLEANQEATLVFVSPRPGHELSFNQVFLNPYTGKVLDHRQFGALTDSWRNILSFVYRLHTSLALGTFGMWVLGICALIWTIDCLVGFYLSLPQRVKRAKDAVVNKTEARTGSMLNGWQRWKPAWKIRWRSSSTKLNFDLHRASGLWLWPILLIFAWSSVYMNLWDTVYTWTTRTVFEYKAPWTEWPKQEDALKDTRQDAKSREPRLNWRQAQAVGRYWMNKQAEQHRFEIDRPVAMWLIRERNVYQYSVRSSRDIQDRRGGTSVFFDADTGAFKLLLLPTGQYNGNTVTSWLYALHMGNVFGLSYRIFVCITGLIVVMLSVTGILIWSRKRRVQKAQAVTWQSVALLREQRLMVLRNALHYCQK